MTGGNAPAVPEKSSEGKKHQFWRELVLSEGPGADDADGDTLSAGAVCSSLAKAAEPIPLAEDGARCSRGRRFGRCTSTPLTLLTQRTGTAGANAGGIDDAETAIMLPTSFMRNQHVACRTAQGSIGLKGKVGSRKVHGMRNEMPFLLKPLRELVQYSSLSSTKG